MVFSVVIDVVDGHEDESSANIKTDQETPPQPTYVENGGGSENVTTDTRGGGGFSTGEGISTEEDKNSGCTQQEGVDVKIDVEFQAEPSEKTPLIPPPQRWCWRFDEE